MKVLTAHNYYQWPGGEDTVFASEQELLRSVGHQVVTYIRHNDEIAAYGLWQKGTLGLRTVWAWDSYREIKALLRAEKPDVAHFHNTFPLISPAAYYACREAGVPVVQSLYNPRLICPAATLYRRGLVCEECVGRTLALPGMLHACYRGSRLQTSVVATMLALHRLLGTWQRPVSMYIVATEFYRRRFIAAGLPAAKVVVKPHFVSPDPGTKLGDGSYCLFIGRLAPEKGVNTLLEAWRRLRNIPLRIRGEGPLFGEANNLACTGRHKVELVPRLSNCDLVALIKGARFLVWPSEGFYETFGLVAVEAFACGVPVIASRLGAMQEIVEDGRTGLHFTPGDADDLAAKVEWAWTHPDEMQEMGRAARAEYEAKYTAERNCQMLMDIYARAAGLRSALQPQPVRSG
jgi:glycosyltransferase involved in cell wall biosynthesis